jgi:hypothetical protein
MEEEAEVGDGRSDEEEDEYVVEEDDENEDARIDDELTRRYVDLASLVFSYFIDRFNLV